LNDGIRREEDGMDRKIVVTGMGAVTPLGNDVATFWEGIKAGKSGIGPITRFDTAASEVKIAAEVRNFVPADYMEKREARKMALFSQYVVAAAVMAMKDAGLSEGNYDKDRVATIVGNGIGGMEVSEANERKLWESGPDRIQPLTVPMMIMNEAPANVALHFGTRGPTYVVATACSSGTDAIGAAFDAIRLGRADIAIAGGTESALTPFGIGCFAVLQTLSTDHNDDPARASRPFDSSRDGFVMGEGAGILILESLDHAKARGARIYAELAGYGSSCDAYHLTSPDPEGSGGALAVRIALEVAGMKPEDIDYYNAHGTATKTNDSTETTMIKRAFGDYARKLRISSTKSMTGHCLGAAGAIEAIVSVMSIVDGFYPPTINLDNPDPECDLDYIPNVGVKGTINAAMSCSLGFGGHNGILIFRRAS
jgi:3-oxoacyl-[acyl-carrier-protein] synthase II